MAPQEFTPGLAMRQLLKQTRQVPVNKWRYKSTSTLTWLFPCGCIKLCNVRKTETQRACYVLVWAFFASIFLGLEELRRWKPPYGTSIFRRASEFSFSSNLVLKATSSLPFTASLPPNCFKSSSPFLFPTSALYRHLNFTGLHHYHFLILGQKCVQELPGGDHDSF